MVGLYNQCMHVNHLEDRVRVRIRSISYSPNGVAVRARLYHHKIAKPALLAKAIGC